MSDQQNVTKYYIRTNALDSGGVNDRFFTEGDGWDDAFAAKVDAALRALQWPANCQFFGVEKTEVATTIYELDQSATPPRFA